MPQPCSAPPGLEIDASGLLWAACALEIDATGLLWAAYVPEIDATKPVRWLLSMEISAPGRFVLLVHSKLMSPSLLGAF